VSPSWLCQSLYSSDRDARACELRNEADRKDSGSSNKADELAAGMWGREQGQLGRRDSDLSSILELIINYKLILVKSSINSLYKTKVYRVTRIWRMRTVSVQITSLFENFISWILEWISRWCERRGYWLLAHVVTWRRCWIMKQILAFCPRLSFHFEQYWSSKL